MWGKYNIVLQPSPWLWETEVDRRSHGRWFSCWTGDLLKGKRLESPQLPHSKLFWPKKTKSLPGCHPVYMCLKGNPIEYSWSYFWVNTQGCTISDKIKSLCTWSQSFCCQNIWRILRNILSEDRLNALAVLFTEQWLMKANKKTPQTLIIGQLNKVQAKRTLGLTLLMYSR